MSINKEFELYPSNSKASLDYSRTYDAERWLSPRADRSGDSLLFRPPKRSMFTPSRLQELSAKQSREARKPYGRCPQPIKPNPTISKSEQMIFDALKTSSGNQNTLLVNDIVEHKTLSDGGYCVMPRPMKSFVKHREIDDGLQSNVFSADTIDLDDGGISKNAVISELETTKPLCLDNFPKAGFIFREETSYVFTFPPPIKRFPKYEPITSQQQSTEQFAQTEENFSIDTDTTRVKTLEEKLSQEVESSERLKQTVGELQSSKKDLENRLEKALKIIEDLKSRNSMPLSYDLFVGQKPLETPALVTKGLDTSTRPESSTNGSLINGIGLKLPGNSISTVSTTPNPTITASISNGVAPLSSFFKPKSSSQSVFNPGNIVSSPNIPSLAPSEHPFGVPSSMSAPGLPTSVAPISSFGSTPAVDTGTKGFFTFQSTGSTFFKPATSASDAPSEKKGLYVPSAPVNGLPDTAIPQTSALGGNIFAGLNNGTTPFSQLLQPYNFGNVAAPSADNATTNVFIQPEQQRNSGIGGRRILHPQKRFAGRR